MKAGDAIHIVNALRECAESLERQLGEQMEGAFVISDVLRGALLELGSSLLSLELGKTHSVLDLSERELAILAALGGQQTPGEVVRYLVASICDGVRRPGSWERVCVTQLFGHARTIDAEAEIEDAYKGAPYREVKS